MICETTHFILHYHEAEAILAEQFIKLLEDKFEEIQRSFQFRDVSQKYTVHLCNSVEEYIDKTGKGKEEYQKWMVGHSNSNTHTICLLSPNASEEAANSDMKKVAAHELVHMVFDDTTGVTEDDVEVWCAEGIAVLYAEQTDLRYFSETNYPKLMELVGFDNFVENGGYDYAGIYVWYFIKRYGFAKFLEVYRNECEWQGMIYDGFEKEAIQNYLRHLNENRSHYAVVHSLGVLPKSEMKEIKIFDTLPAELTYPQTSPKLYAEAAKKLGELYGNE